MNAATTRRQRTIRRIGTAILVGALAVGATACGHMMMMIHGTGATPPPASEFGLGPRTSATGLYTATLDADQPLRTRRLQTVRVRVADAKGRALDGASIRVDGGMPQHGHGLPTAPRVTANAGDGIYVIEGVRFNMGGWWEFTLAITSTAGTDQVTFNLQL
jgi:hypothetical protein